jgi:hypothetical protein
MQGEGERDRAMETGLMIALGWQVFVLGMILVYGKWSDRSE